MRGSRIAYSTDCPGKARALTSKPFPTSPSRTNSPFFVPTRISVISSSCDRGQDVDPIGSPDLRLSLCELTVDIDVDVLADHPPLVEHPPRNGRRMISPTRSASPSRCCLRGRARARLRARRAVREGERAPSADPIVGVAPRRCLRCELENPVRRAVVGELVEERLGGECLRPEHPGAAPRSVREELESARGVERGLPDDRL